MVDEPRAEGYASQSSEQGQQDTPAYSDAGEPSPDSGGGSSFNWTWVVVAALLVVGLLGAVALYNQGQAQQAASQAAAVDDSVQRLEDGAQQVDDSAGRLEQAISDLESSIQDLRDDLGSNAPAPDASGEAPTAPSGQSESDE
jgi:uncharacterized protein YlxW (UPF0749 family)